MYSALILGLHIFCIIFNTCIVPYIYSITEPRETKASILRVHCYECTSIPETMQTKWIRSRSIFIKIVHLFRTNRRAYEYRTAPVSRFDCSTCFVLIIDPLVITRNGVLKLSQKCWRTQRYVLSFALLVSIIVGWNVRAHDSPFTYRETRLLSVKRGTYERRNKRFY